MNKKLLFSMLGLFAVGLVSAGYLVNSLVITTDVMEPFNVQYAIMGDAGNYVSGDCKDATNWQDAGSIDVGGLYAGESRKICTKIVNAGEGEIDYTFFAEATAGGNDCADAFTAVSVEAVADGEKTSYSGILANVDDGAAPADNCELTLSVTRGSNSD